LRRVALITGVSRRVGIGAAVARRLAPDHDLLLTGLPSYDDRQPHGGDRQGVPELLAELSRMGTRAQHLTVDLRDSTTPHRLVTAAVTAYGGLDTLVANHAHSTPTSLDSVSAEQLDAHLLVNVRATLLLVQAFGKAHDPVRGGGRIVLFSSGQSRGPMPGELAYAASKGALEALVPSLADTLADRGITVNAVNPGPTNTGYLDGLDAERVRRRFPQGRWGEPDDAARLVNWLCGEDARWITGQVIHSEGGFRRYG
jgi:Dehydrogenases with different specificities (related to short-chain alcohol dehydrogenases)